VDRKKTEKIIVTFESSQDAVVMERLSRAENIPGRLIPVPRSISASCGLCWMTEKSEEKKVRRFIEDKKLRHGGFHQIEMF
jgi:hypothetical protein